MGFRQTERDDCGYKPNLDRFSSPWPSRPNKWQPSVTFVTRPSFMSLSGSPWISGTFLHLPQSSIPCPPLETCAWSGPIPLSAQDWYVEPGSGQDGRHPRATSLICSGKITKDAVPKPIAQRGINCHHEEFQNEQSNLDSALVVMPFQSHRMREKMTPPTTMACVELCMFAECTEGSRHQGEDIVTGTKVRTTCGCECQHTHAHYYDGLTQQLSPWCVWRLDCPKTRSIHVVAPT